MHENSNKNIVLENGSSIIEEEKSEESVDSKF